VSAFTDAHHGAARPPQTARCALTAATRICGASVA